MPDTTSHRIRRLYTLITTAKAGVEASHELPLAYSLLMDSKVPFRPKAILAGTITFAVSSTLIPFTGELDLLMAIHALGTFINQCNEVRPMLVIHHREAVASHTSTWHNHQRVGLDHGKQFTRAVIHLIPLHRQHTVLPDTLHLHEDRELT